MLLIIILENKENRKGWNVITRPSVHPPIHTIKHFGIFVSAGEIDISSNLPGTNWIKYKILKWTPYGICFADSLRGINISVCSYICRTRVLACELQNSFLWYSSEITFAWCYHTTFEIESVFFNIVRNNWRCLQATVVWFLMTFWSNRPPNGSENFLDWFKIFTKITLNGSNPYEFWYVQKNVFNY